jgi:hypothetical protein
LRLAVQWSIKHPQGKQVATVIPLQRRRLQKGTADKHSAEAFWRNSMVPASIAMGVIIVAAVATLGVGVKTGWLGEDSSRWVLVAALVSVIGLTKIVIANMFFFLLMQDDARLDPPPAPPPPTPGTRLNHQTRPLRIPARAISARQPRRAGRRTRVATVSGD